MQVGEKGGEREREGAEHLQRTVETVPNRRIPEQNSCSLQRMECTLPNTAVSRIHLPVERICSQRVLWQIVLLKATSSGSKLSLFHAGCTASQSLKTEWTENGYPNSTCCDLLILHRPWGIATARPGP